AMIEPDDRELDRVFGRVLLGGAGCHLVCHLASRLERQHSLGQSPYDSRRSRGFQKGAPTYSIFRHAGSVALRQVAWTIDQLATHCSRRMRLSGTCGRRIRIVMSEESNEGEGNMAQHVKILGILHIIYGGLGVF